jgi:hypothetical protein
MQCNCDIFLHAHPVLETFWFVLGETKSLQIQLHFVHRENHLYDLKIERVYVDNTLDPRFFNEKDIDSLLYAVVNIIEIYTGKYPERSLRCEAHDQIQAAIFRIILRANHDIMVKLFSIQAEDKGVKSTGIRPKNPVFVVKRTVPMQPVIRLAHQMLSTYSQLFGTPVQIRLSLPKRK